MLLTYSGPQVQRFLEAIDAGLVIVVIQVRNVLSLDIDSNKSTFDEEALQELLDAGVIKRQWGPPAAIEHEGRILYKKTTSSKPMMHKTTSISGGEHVYLGLRTKLTPEQYRDYALMLGSDPARERYSYERRTGHHQNIGADEHPYVMFERPENVQSIRRFHSMCRFEGVQVLNESHFDRETMTYDSPDSRLMRMASKYDSLLEETTILDLDDLPF